MKLFHFFLISFLCLTSNGFSQEITWRFGLLSFFDNLEFRQSALKESQTMAGVMILPEAGLRWDSVHRVNIGLGVLREFGSSNEIDNFFLTAYYAYDHKPVRFYMGAFPRNYALERYPRLFFQDSVSYYRPNINGILCEFNNVNLQANAWLDWTGRQSREVNETFLLGFSGRYMTDPLYFQFFTYLFHFAGKMDPAVQESLHDNGLMLISAGLELSERTGLNKLEINAGWVAGLERSRSETGWIRQNGFLSEFYIEFWKAGLFNSFYKGSGQMHFYSKHGNKLYWGDPLYRAKTYNRLDLYLNIFNSKNIGSRVTYSLHFAGGRMYHEQSLKLSVKL